ncbi:MAG: glycosyltransferase [Verrucomicrobiae bacterium]|nr:glycosyltransferase [Verrucomicrobiae bacterium]
MSRKLRILWVKSGPLFPLNTGGRRRTHAMLTELSRVHHVTWLAGLPIATRLDSREEADPYAREKHWIRTVESAKGSLRFYFEILANLTSTFPYVLDRYRCPEIREKIRSFDACGDFDLIVCDFLTPAVHFTGWQTKTPAVLFQHNVESQIWQRLTEEKTNTPSRFYFRNQYRRMFRAERRLSADFDGVITVSPEDSRFCREEYGLTNILGEVPTGVDTDYFAPPANREPERGLIGFLGSMDWMPNVECVQHFARDIFPDIKARHPEARFRIIGRSPTSSVRQLAAESPDIEVTGTVEDVRPHLDSCEVLVVPLRSGGGTRIKIFEAMAQGVPVVSTMIGAEGLPVTHERDILIADDPGEFGNAVVRLIEDAQLAKTLSTNARQKLVAEHSWESVTRKFVELCLSVTKAKN